MSISGELFIAICWSSLLFESFVIKKWVVLRLTSFGTLKYDYVIKTREIFNFLPLINSSVTIESNLLPKTINAFYSG